VHVAGLTELVACIEDQNRDTIASHRAAIEHGSVEFEALGELFTPGRIVAGPTSLGLGVTAAYRVHTSWFEEKKTMFRMEQLFKMRLETIVPFGRYYALIQFEEVYSGWTGAKVKALEELGVAIPVNAGTDLEKVLIERGSKCVKILARGADQDAPSFLQYNSSSFILHGGSKRGLVPSASSGRIVIDSERGLLLGHYPAQGSDEVTLAIQNAANRYKRIMGDPSFSKLVHGQPPVADSMLLYQTPPSALHALIWPAAVGFSFAVKAWGHVLVDALSPIPFNDHAFDQLVLHPQRKKLIKALVRFGGKSTTSKFEDIVAGKSGGSVFLLHGPPGTGKTLTAEAIAELLHKPLYYVTMGELGTNPEEMEKRLGTVLELCSGWDALAIIDEADVFLEKRATSASGGSDVLRNAMVCVMLRLLEYHQGILFLTTNRVREFDPALESRLTVALRYDHLDAAARELVWRNLIGRLSGVVVSEDIDYAKLSVPVLNGRQIKNAVRLALALAEDEQCALTQDLIDQTMAITSIGREEMVRDVYEL
ncbi:P-loop containing nucleoside triphosphate hydrolase protein, partial [Chytriomyces sp. MP71]